MTGTITNEKSRLMFRLALYQAVKKERDQMMTSQERVFNKSRFINVRISIPKQYQMMMSLVSRIKFIKANVIFRYHTNGVSN